MSTAAALRNALFSNPGDVYDVDSEEERRQVPDSHQHGQRQNHQSQHRKGGQQRGQRRH